MHAAEPVHAANMEGVLAGQVLGADHQVADLHGRSDFVSLAMAYRRDAPTSSTSISSTVRSSPSLVVLLRAFSRPVTTTRELRSRVWATFSAWPRHTEQRM